jgi:hypothetical protein
VRVFVCVFVDVLMCEKVVSRLMVVDDVAHLFGKVLGPTDMYIFLYVYM